MTGWCGPTRAAAPQGTDWSRCPDQHPADYDDRARAVYWHHHPACLAKGPQRARCLLLPDHGGDRHYGNGYDAYGPKGAISWPVSRPAPNPGR